MGKKDIYAFIDRITDGKFDTNPLFDVCLDDALSLRYIVDDVEIIPSPEQVVLFAAKSVKRLLNTCQKDLTLSYRNICVNDYIQNRDNFLIQFDQLIYLCEE